MQPRDGLWGQRPDRDLCSLEEILKGHDSSAYPPQLSSTSLLKLNVTQCRWCQLEVNYSLNTLYFWGQLFV